VGGETKVIKKEKKICQVGPYGGSLYGVVDIGDDGCGRIETVL
jgi:hypothetical protein